MWMRACLVAVILSLCAGQQTFAPSIVIKPTPEPQPETQIPVPVVTGQPAVSTEVPDLVTSEPESGTDAPDIDVDVDIYPHNETDSEIVVPPPNEKVMQGIETASTIAAASASGSAGQIALIADTRCGEEELPIVLHPLQITGMATVNRSLYLAAVLGNAIVVITFTLFTVLLTFAIHLYRTHTSDRERTKTYAEENLYYRSLLRFPSSTLVVFLCLYQGTSLSALKLVLEFESAGTVIAGLVSGAICVVVPAVLAITIKRDVENGLGSFHIISSAEPKTLKTKIEHFIIGEGEWVSETWGWIQRYTTMVRAYNTSYPWFILFEFLTSGLLSIANAPSNKEHSTTICGHTRLFSGLICIALAVIQFIINPHTRYRDQFLAPTRVLMQGVSLIAMSVGFYTATDWCFTLGSIFLTIAVSLLIIKLILDLATECYVFLVRRRTIHQKDYWSVIGADQSDPITKSLLQDSCEEGSTTSVADTQVEMKILIHASTKRELLRPEPMTLVEAGSNCSEGPMVLFDGSDVETVEDSSSDTPRSVCSYNPPPVPPPVRGHRGSGESSPGREMQFIRTPRRAGRASGGSVVSGFGPVTSPPSPMPRGTPRTPVRNGRSPVSPGGRSRRGSPAGFPLSPLSGFPVSPTSNMRRPLTPSGRGSRSLAPRFDGKRRSSLPAVESFCGFSVPAGRGRKQAKRLHNN
eukprot:TRINITY_DN18276_c0_g1_i1.p1 TRINITY_DN18276_c0_g1~~TRINITY_DN18276_c0_g1_i1.p1  ORF type:complete len:693 (+),score=92.97 TRINITY_DN18276_c0_g1_i1:44-2122(+)